MKPLFFLLALTFAATAARAHGPGYPAPPHFVPLSHPQVYPRWLRHDHAFRHWYAQQRYHFHPHPGWHRLYELYRHDYRHHRRGHHHRRYCKHRQRHRHRYGH